MSNEKGQPEETIPTIYTLVIGPKIKELEVLNSGESEGVDKLQPTLDIPVKSYDITLGDEMATRSVKIGNEIKEIKINKNKKDILQMLKEKGIKRQNRDIRTRGEEK